MSRMLSKRKKRNRSKVDGVQRLDELMERLAGQPAEESATVRLDDSDFSTIQKKHIYQVYADGADAMFQAVLQNPHEALPTLSARLIRKGSEWWSVRSVETGTSAVLVIDLRKCEKCLDVRRPSLFVCFRYQTRRDRSLSYDGSPALNGTTRL
jgi:histone deacetylase complex regulatory component SIN3